MAIRARASAALGNDTSARVAIAGTQDRTRAADKNARRFSAKELERDTFGTDRIATTMSSGNQGVSNDGALVSKNTGNFAEALGLFAPEATSVVDPPSTHLPANTPSRIDSTAQSVDPRTQSVNPRIHFVVFESG